MLGWDTDHPPSPFGSPVSRKLGARGRARSGGVRRQRAGDRTPGTARSHPRRYVQHQIRGGGRAAGAGIYPRAVGDPCPPSRLSRCSGTAMSFTEIDLFGVYVAPMSLMLVAAWLVLLALRRIWNRLGLLRRVWHPALFEFAGFMIRLSSLVLPAPRLAS